MSNSDAEQSVVLQLTRSLLVLFGFIGFTAVGVGIWQWASTKPDLVIGEDIAPETVLVGMIAVVIITTVVGITLLYRTLRQYQADSEKVEADQELGGHSTRDENNVTDSRDTSSDDEIGSDTERDPNPPTEDSEVNLERDSSFSEAEQETDIVFSDGPAPGDEGGNDPNRHEPGADNDSAPGASTDHEQTGSPESSGTGTNSEDASAGRDPSDTDTVSDTVNEGAGRQPDVSIDNEGDIQPAERGHVPQWLRDRL